jgi:two-component system NtrC family sensor kinase
LSICYGIIREHGGDLWAESNLGGGASFHIELPIVAETTRDAAPGTETYAGLSPKMRIIVVDDEPVFRNTMFRALTADGHDVVLASNGQNAWQLIQSTGFDIIFADLSMPGLDGQSFYRLASEVSPDLAKKLVFVTGDTTSAEANEFFTMAGNPALSKPFDLNEDRQLIGTIEQSTS